MKINNKKIEIFKYFIPLIIQLIIYLGWLIYEKYTTMFIYIENALVERSPEKKIQVPRWIVLTKNCKDFKEFADSVISSYVSFSGCPWETPDPIGNFEIGSASFSIPRKILRFGKNGSDGKSLALYLNIEYINKEAETASRNISSVSNIELTIYPIPKGFFKLQEKLFVNWAQNTFLENSGIMFKIMEIAKDQKKFESNIDYIPELDMKTFDNKRKHKIVYYEGELFKPSYWVICEYEKESNPKCESAFVYKDDVFITYNFPRALLDQHRKIKETIDQQLMEFRIAPKKK